MQNTTRKKTNISLLLLVVGIITVLSAPALAYNATTIADPSFSFDSIPKSADNDTVLNLVMIWHQHQPSYQDPETSVYEQPWVFMHGSNSYPYMADVLNDYPDINVTINLTPSMLQQLMDYIDGVEYDRRIELARMDEAAMSDENKSIILQYFFDINSQFRQNGTRYAELTERRNSYPTLQEAVDGFTDQELLDLKALFFAHWINPRYTTELPYYPPANNFGKTLLVLTNDAAGVGGYSSDLKRAVIDYAYEIVRTTIDLHADAQDRGQLEIITTPFYHPILPLLIDLGNAQEVNDGVADLPLPTQQTGWTEDAIKQIEMGKNYTDFLFGQTPVGMWPSEEAVSDEIIPLVNQSGLEWFVTDYTVLQNSLGVGNLSPEQWFKPYRVEKDGSSSVAFFRHQQLSDEVGFNYGGLDPETASDNMITLLKGIRDDWTGGIDPVFTVALDGENAWENYQYDLNDDGIMDYTGNMFRELMYEKLQIAQDAGWLQTLTPKQYLANHSAESLDPLNLATGSWASDLNVWIGESDENEAWDRLITARNDLLDYMTTNVLTKDDLPDAWEALYAAEGSDWFWWYGADKDSGHDELFDWQFKTILRGMYKEIEWTDEDIMAAYPHLFLKMMPPVAANIQGKYLPTVDGIDTEADEWTQAAQYVHAPAESTSRLFENIYVGVDEGLETLHLRFDTTDMYDLATIGDYSAGIYFSNPNSEDKTIFPRFADTANENEILGFELSTEVRIELDSGSSSVYFVNPANDWEITASTVSVAIDDFVELSIPFSVLGIAKGDLIYMSFVATNDTFTENFDHTPEDGPWSLNIPFGGVDMVEVFAMEDPNYDEHGIYPTNPEMHPDYNVTETGLMDIIRFRVGYMEGTVFFEFKFRELFNPWGGPGGYSHPLMQVYIDQDRVDGSGRTDSDQNGHFTIQEEFAWEYMVRADGWLQYILLEDDSQVSGVSTYSDSVDKVIVFSAPASVIGTPTEDWSYTVVVGSQDFQAFRDFYEVEQEWKFGGGDDSAIDPNVIDCLVPYGYNQTLVLADYDVPSETFCTIPAVGPRVGGLDSTPPTVSITTITTLFTIPPENNDSFFDVFFEWTGEDNNKLAQFDILVDDVLNISLDDEVFEHTLRLAAGNYTITVRAVDLNGLTAEDTLDIVVEGGITVDPSTTDPDDGNGIPGYSGVTLISALFVGLWILRIRSRRKR